MSSRSIRRLALATCVLAGCICLSGCGNSGCSVQNCQAVIDSCHITSASDVYALCVDALANGNTSPDGGAPAPTADAYDECQRACDRDSTGSLFSCLAGKASQCTGDPSTETALVSSCAPSSATIPDPSCVAICHSTLGQCVYDCPNTQMSDCLPCADSCAGDYASCVSGCDTVPTGTSGS